MKLAVQLSEVPAGGGGDGVKQQAVGCLATEREIYNELSPQRRWGDFGEIRLATFEVVREAFSPVAKAPVSLQGAIIEVVADS